MFFQMFLIGAYLVQRDKDKISGLDAFQIGKPADQDAGQVIVGQHHIPVIPDGDR